jgi:hypothetical protein
MKIYAGMEVRLPTNSIEGLVENIAGLDDMKKRKSLIPSGDRSPVVQPIT